MSTTYDTHHSGQPPINPVPSPPPMHRIRQVRIEQGVTLRTAARRMGVDIREARRQEQELSNLTLTELYAWGKALRTPIEDLLHEPNADLSRPVLERAQLVRLMKSAASIYESTPSTPTRRMAHTLIEQLILMMPELASVSPWQSAGQRRTLDEFGRAADRVG